jgi:hypothetical protein
MGYMQKSIYGLIKRSFVMGQHGWKSELTVSFC